MNPLPSFTRVCARRTTLIPTRSLPSTTSSTRTSITKPHFQQQTQIHPHPRHLTTSTVSPTTDSPPVDLPPSPTSTSTSPLSTTSPFLLTGTVSRTGTMKHCIQITQNKQIYDAHLQKHYTRPSHMLIHDPNPPGYLTEGDVIEFGLFSESERAARLGRKAEWAKKLEGVKRKGGKKAERTQWRGPKMVFRRVVTAFGIGVDERMERVVKMQAEVKEEVVPASKRGRAGKQHGSAKVAG